MAYAVLLVIGIPLFALVFSVTVKFLGLFWGRFQTSGGGFGALYAKFLAIAAVYMFLAMLGVGGLLGFLAMILGYKLLFGAGWVEALVIGLLGGFVGWVLLIVVLACLYAAGLPLG